MSKENVETLLNTTELKTDTTLLVYQMLVKLNEQGLINGEVTIPGGIDPIIIDAYFKDDGKNYDFSITPYIENTTGMSEGKTMVVLYSNNYGIAAAVWKKAGIFKLPTGSIISGDVVFAGQIINGQLVCTGNCDELLSELPGQRANRLHAELSITPEGVKLLLIDDEKNVQYEWAKDEGGVEKFIPRNVEKYLVATEQALTATEQALTALPKRVDYSIEFEGASYKVIDVRPGETIAETFLNPEAIEWKQVDGKSFIFDKDTGIAVETTSKELLDEYELDFGFRKWKGVPPFDFPGAQPYSLRGIVIGIREETVTDGEGGEAKNYSYIFIDVFDPSTNQTYRAVANIDGKNMIYPQGIYIGENDINVEESDFNENIQSIYIMGGEPHKKQEPKVIAGYLSLGYYAMFCTMPIEALRRYETHSYGGLFTPKNNDFTNWTLRNMAETGTQSSPNAGIIFLLTFITK